MKILHLPRNIGSKITLTVSALRKLGADARGIAINNYLDEAGVHVQAFNPGLRSYLDPKKYTDYFRAKHAITESILWADVIHWYYEPAILRTEGFVDMVRRFNKPAVVEWLGSDIRIAERLASHNSYYKKAIETEYPYREETKEHSYAVQEKFSRAGFIPLVRPELEEFVRKDIFQKYYPVSNRINTGDYPPVYPSASASKVVIVHPVSLREAKGTRYVLEAVNKLKQKYDVEFHLLETIPHAEVMKRMREADIVIDQLIIGAFGTTTLEGLALGKPTVCYLDEVLRSKLPASCPIVNASPDTIYSVLESLAANPELRNRAGRQSRKYAEEYHDAGKAAQQLMEIYTATIQSRPRR